MKPRQAAKASFQSCLGTLVASLILFSGAGLVVSSSWLSVQFILDPRSLAWMNPYLPAHLKLPVAEKDTRPTLGQIKTALQKMGLQAGETMVLSRVPNTTDRSFDMLMPVSRSGADCTENCDRIVELRVYRVTPPRAKVRESLRLIYQLSTEGLEEFVMLEPLVLARAAEPGSTRLMPLTTLERFSDGAPTQGVWLNLSGKQPNSNNPITYGQILHYNPQSGHLGIMAAWTSPVGQSPTWRNMTGSKTPELIVNQTVDLDPDLKIYQIQPRKFKPHPIQLKPIELKQAALTDWAYDNALKLARSGLWSVAQRQLEDVKAYYGKSGWPNAAQAQLDLITEHAKLTQAQANQTAANPREQVLVNLLDGRWSQAIAVFKRSTLDRSEITDMLKLDSGRLWQRIATTLKLNPRQPEAQAWGALLLAAKQGKPTALAWLQKQGANSDREIQTLLKQLDSTLTNSQLDAPPAEVVSTPRSLIAPPKQNDPPAIN